MKLKDEFKKDFLKELSSPDQSNAIKEKIGINQNSTNDVVVHSSSFWE